MADDLFASPRPEPAEGTARAPTDYDAHSIEVLEGLEPVRRRPGMYVGGVDERALHHLAAEVLDNSMDEAVAGHATRIEMILEESGRLTIIDNGRGIPVDEHCGVAYHAGRDRKPPPPLPFGGLGCAREQLQAPKARAQLLLHRRPGSRPH